MREEEYFHGYADDEQQRLIRQAEYWRRSLIPLGLSYRAGQRVLEIGCAAGATLAVLARDFPGIEVAGVDREARQIEFALGHFASLGLPKADLRVADASALPWEDDCFDHVYIMWLIEHLPDSAPVLREAKRVLGPGGTITVTETDYTTFKLLPPSPDWDHLEAAQLAFFTRHGNPVAGRALGVLLRAAGFAEIRNAPVGFHFFQGGGDGLRRHAAYVAEFLEPGIGKMAQRGFDEESLRRGLAHLRSIPEHPEGAMTQSVYRAHAVKPAP